MLVLLNSSLLSLSASSRSTRSLHRISICLSESCNAFSVLVRGLHPDGTLYALW